MTDGFIRKKVESLTLGEKLKKLRQQYRMSYAEIAKATRIQAKYLEALENGEYEKLPAEVYIRGFLRSYARYLGLDDTAFLKLYDKEKNIRVNLGHEKIVPEALRYPTMNAWVITPRAVLITLLVLVLGGTFLYLLSEFRSFVVEPRLLILEPLPGATIEGAGIVLKGKTDPGVGVTINGEPVFVGASGEFSESLVLQSGLNQITVRAENRFEKIKEETVAVESRSLEMLRENEVSEVVSTDAYSFTIRAKTRSVDVTVANGETVLYSGTLLPGKEERFINLSGEVRLSTDDGLHTEVSLDDAPSEPVSQTEEKVSGKIYVKQTPSNDKQ